MIQISEELAAFKKKTHSQKTLFVQSRLTQVNQRLPACVYVPFCKKSTRHYVVLNIVEQETIIFNTKDRQPFYICLEIFRPEEYLLFCILETCSSNSPPRNHP